MLHSDKILQMKTLHCMQWWTDGRQCQMLTFIDCIMVCNLTSCLCRDFCDFHKSSPWFLPFFCRDFLLWLSMNKDCSVIKTLHHSNFIQRLKWLAENRLGSAPEHYAHINSAATFTGRCKTVETKCPTLIGGFRQYVWWPRSHPSHSSILSALPQRRQIRQRAWSTDRDHATDDSNTERWTATRDTLDGRDINDASQWLRVVLPDSE